MDTVIRDVANQLLNITNTQILAKGDVFNNLEQTQIKIGKNPAFTQSANSIILNATGGNLSNTLANSCVIKPIRDTLVKSFILSYDPDTGEVVRSPVAMLQNLVGTQDALSKIKIGLGAGIVTHANNSIIINATGATLNNPNANSCVIAPIREATVIGNQFLNYNPTTKEVSTVPLTTMGVVNNEIEIFSSDDTVQSKFLIGTPILFNVFAKMTVTLNAPEVGYSTIHCNRKTPNNTGGYVIAFTHTNTVTNATNLTGTIVTTSSGVAYNTASDYRLKNVVGEITDAPTRLLALKPIRFSWKSTGEVVDGFLAHEAQAVVPEAVTGVKDAVDEDGNPQYQGIDQSKLVPLLVASLQDALKRIAVLEAQLA